jgi:hypothetical protein
MKHIGVDIGGSHITAAQVDLHKGEVLTATLSRAKVHPHGTAEEFWVLGQTQSGSTRWFGRGSRLVLQCQDLSII